MATAIENSTNQNNLPSFLQNLNPRDDESVVKVDEDSDQEEYGVCTSCSSQQTISLNVIYADSGKEIDRETKRIPLRSKILIRMIPRYCWDDGFEIRERVYPVINGDDEYAKPKQPPKDMTPGTKEPASFEYVCVRPGPLEIYGTLTITTRDAEENSEGLGSGYWQPGAGHKTFKSAKLKLMVVKE